LLTVKIIFKKKFIVYSYLLEQLSSFSFRDIICVLNLPFITRFCLIGLVYAFIANISPRYNYAKQRIYPQEWQFHKPMRLERQQETQSNVGKLFYLLARFGLLPGQRMRRTGAQRSTHMPAGLHRRM